MPSHTGPDAPDRTAERFVPALAVLVVVTHALGFASRGGLFWGADAYAGYAPYVLAGASLALLAFAALTLRRATAGAELAPRTDPDVPMKAPLARRYWLVPALAFVGAATFWVARSSHILLGDGISITTSLAGDTSFHPFEPFSMRLEQMALAAFARLPGHAEIESFRESWRAVAIVSVAAGAVFLPVLWALASRLADLAPRAFARRRSLIVTLIFGTLAAQGYMQLFFGYVEIYALSMLGIALYLLAAMRFAQDRAPLWPAALALAFAVGLHLASLALVPSFLVLVTVAWLDRERRVARMRDFALCTACLGMLIVTLTLMGDGSNPWSTTLTLVRTVFFSQHESAKGYFFGWAHVRDLLNEQWLIGPLALALFVPAAIAAIRRRAMTRHTVFFLAVGGGMVVVALIAGDSNLGYARNWDLLAPAGFALAVAGAAIALPRLAHARNATAVLALALALSLYHTVPWVAVNASFPRALARFTTLPLGLGRVQSTVGFWYAMNGDDTEAEKWLVRSLDENPGNVRAHVYLGDVWARRGDYARAVVAYRAAVTLMPDWRDYRLRLVDALVRSGAPGEAVPEARLLIEHEPTNPRLWSVYGIVLLGAGQIDAARSAFRVARIDAPESLLYTLILNYADVPEGFERALGDVWGSLIGPTS
jgi:tetratricopeptide (TPR) repeat protein